MEAGDERYAAPQARVEDQVVEVAGQTLAPLGRRLAAFAIDGGIFIAVTVLLMRLWPPLYAGWIGEPNWQTVLARVVLAWLLFFCFNGYLLRRRGQTIGKAVLRLRIARPNGVQPSLWRLLGLRYAVLGVITALPLHTVIYTLVDCLMVLRRSRRSLHDDMADTIVVKA